MKCIDKLYIKCIVKKVEAAKAQGLEQLVIHYDPSWLAPYPLSKWVREELLDRYGIKVREMEWSNKDFRRIFRWKV